MSLRPPLHPHLPYTTLFRSAQQQTLAADQHTVVRPLQPGGQRAVATVRSLLRRASLGAHHQQRAVAGGLRTRDRKSTRLNSSHVRNSYAVFCSKQNKIPPPS